MPNKTIAVILSGCGVYDGAEIQEAVLSLLAVDRAGASYQCFAPDVAQTHVINHLTGEEAPETRNVLVEAARIARGAIKPLAQLIPADFDAILLPGGFGAAKNLCTFAFAGPECVVEPQIERVIKQAHAAGKPIGALCIAPALIAKVLGRVTVTIGSDEAIAAGIQAMGGTHQNAGHCEIVVDEAAKLVTSPCYMLDASISQIAAGAEAVVLRLLQMAD